MLYNLSHPVLKVALVSLSETTATHNYVTRSIKGSVRGDGQRLVEDIIVILYQLVHNGAVYWQRDVSLARRVPALDALNFVVPLYLWRRSVERQ